MTIRWDNPERVTRDDGTPSDWWIVATDPHVLMYADEDWRAMDETNWDAFIGMLDPDDLDDETDDETEGSWCIEGRALLIREGTDAWDVWEDVSRQLANYPLLDEWAYSEREHDAWMEYAESDWGWDLDRNYGDRISDELIAAGMPVDGWTMYGVDGMDIYDMVTEYLSTDDWQHEAMTWMAYYNGFTGEADDDTAADVIARRLVTAWQLFGMLATAGHDWSMAAAGYARLPFGA